MIMKKYLVLTAFLGLFMSANNANAIIIDVDLSGATSGTIVDGIGADFAGIFVGQSIVGSTGISGSPTGPLTLQAANNLTVASFSLPSGTSNSILPNPGNVGPLSMLLDSEASSISWTMGHASPPSSVTVDFFDIGGALVNSLVQDLLSGYNAYSFSGFGDFAGLSIYDNNDSAGLRFMEISYDTASVPEPPVLLLLGVGLIGLFVARRRA